MEPKHYATFLRHTTLAHFNAWPPVLPPRRLKYPTPAITVLLSPPAMGSHSFLLFAALVLLLPSTHNAAVHGGEADVGGGTRTYIVRVRNELKPSVFPDVDNWYSSTLKTLSPSSPLNDAREDPRGGLIHVYRTVFHGFSAALTAAEADLLRARPGVLAVIPDRPRRLHTTRSPQFLGLVSSNSRPNSLLAGSDFGSGTVIAVLDTGIHPEHRSFRDAGLGPVPSRWRGACEAGDRSFPVASCNRKLVGAKFFPSGFMAAKGARPNITGDLLSPRDNDGHGTHTASTAAGRPADRASMLGYAVGVASGVAPKARIAAYKVCWSSGCFDSDILHGLDVAVEDGADVISLSVGSGPAPYHFDPIAIGAFGAMEKGVLVSTSAGNDGPGEMTVTNIAPWITTVGAGTIDRNFPAVVVLGNGAVVTGASLYAGPPVPPDRSFPLVNAGNASTSAPFCMRGSLDPDLVRGKVVLCERGAIPRVEKGMAVMEAGGAGMIVANQSPDGDSVVPDAHLLPAVAVGASAGYSIHAYISTNSDPHVRFVFHGTQLGVKPAPVVASFSARGPSAQSPYILKPDLIAPGVSILAAWPDGKGPTGLPSDSRRTEFNIMSGTSMACPHVSGLAALLKGAHPDWSPAIIRSALMTTAYNTDNMGQELLDQSSGNASVGWAVGAGHVDPEKAMDPGLVYNLTTDDYLGFLCKSNYIRRDIRIIARRTVSCSKKAGKPWDLNYPAIVVVLDQTAPGKLSATVRRTVTNVAEGASEYTVSVRNPTGAWIMVEPKKLVFEGKGQQQGFVVRVSGERVSLPPWNLRTEFGSLTWRDGKHTVRSAVGVTWHNSSMQ